MDIVFLPYKASMWDAMESVWKAACEDPDCDAYVVPIPYYDKNADGTFGTFHYDGALFPDTVPVVDYQNFDIAERRPDIIVIHYPYDGANFVTSIHPDYYSSRLRQYTDCLCYIPYYATTGGMSEEQALLPAYIYADYIVIQSEKFRKFFDARILDEKFLALGSPKFDNVIHKCLNPPTEPGEWKKYLYDTDGKRKTVYFYNTSIGGMLSDTASFLDKMEYVFHTFEKHKEVCLLWRPHPLLESAIQSMRQEYIERYNSLRRYYIQDEIGIYDTTPIIEDTIALSDVYIGDAGTSVTALFGVAGKPQFILNNWIHRAPVPEDAVSDLLPCVWNQDGEDTWIVTPYNQLWRDGNGQHHYQFMTKLSDYTGGGYYNQTLTIEDKVYILPQSAQDFLIYENGNLTKVPFTRQIEQGRAFVNVLRAEHYLFFLPDQYPQMVRYDLDTGEILYVNDIKELTTIDLEGRRCIGGSCIWGHHLVLASPVMNRVILMDIHTLRLQVKVLPIDENQGTCCIVPMEDTLWLLPTRGFRMVRWKPESDVVQQYEQMPAGFTCISYPEQQICDFFPFGNVTRIGEEYVISPAWGNQFVAIHRETGNIREWIPPVLEEKSEKKPSEAYALTGEPVRGFAYAPYTEDAKLYLNCERTWYRYRAEHHSYEKIEITFDEDDLREQEPGYGSDSEWLVYCCHESSRNTLEDLINGTLKGHAFDWEEELTEYEKINASPKGDCGAKVYAYLANEVRKKLI